MGLLDGLRAIVKGSLGSLFMPVVDPRPATRLAADHLDDVLALVRRSLTAVASAHDRLEAHARQLHERLDALEERARGLVDAGRDDKARAVIEHRQAVLRALEPLDAQVRGMAGEEERLNTTEQRLAAQLDAIRTREDLAAARYSAAEAQVRVSELLAGISDEVTTLGPALEQAVARTGEMHARATAFDQLMTEGIIGPRDAG